MEHKQENRKWHKVYICKCNVIAKLLKYNHLCFVFVFLYLFS